MKKFTAICMIIMFCFMMSGCGDDMKIKNNTYTRYGLLNQEQDKNPDIEYRLIVGNLIWSVILIETIVAPVYFIGFDLYEPVGLKNENRVKGLVE